MIRHRTLVANVVLALDLGSDVGGSDVGSVAILNRGTSDVFVRTDGVDPVADADDTPVIPPGVRRVLAIVGAGNSVVKLRSAGTPKVEIEA